MFLLTIVLSLSNGENVIHPHILDVETRVECNHIARGYVPDLITVIHLSSGNQKVVGYDYVCHTLFDEAGFFPDNLTEHYNYP